MNNDMNVLMNATPCPRGDGGFDCTPFCPSCEGAQFVDGMPELWTLETVVKCDECNCPMLPNVSTWDSEGCAWICATPSCGDYSGDELDADDLTAVGVPEWVAVWLVAHIENLATAANS
jgi:hypothetical protein